MKLFDSRLGKRGSISKAKVIMVLMDYGLKMEKILEEMRALFGSLELKAPSQPIPLEEMPNISINTEVLPSFEQWA